MTSFWILALALGIAFGDWFALATGKQWLDYVAKPGVMIGLLASVHFSSLAPPMRMWFSLALLFSLLGDIFLMLPKERFRAGLLSFLLAHLAYIAGFLRQAPPRWDVVPLLPLPIAAGTYMLGRRILAGLSARGHQSLRIPVAVYMGVIAAMLLVAWGTWFHPNRPVGASVAVSVGALLFLLSDALLAWNRFVRPLAQARLKVRVLYHVGQVLLVGGILLAG